MTPRILVLLLAAAVTQSACGEPTSTIAGSLVVVTNTAGESPDEDGYIVRIDSTASRRIGATDTLTVSLVPGGTHQVVLSEVAHNCGLTGDSTHIVSVGSDDSARVEYDVTCHSSAASLRVTTVTTGTDIDPNGYVLLVDGLPSPDTVEANGIYTMDAAPGIHALALGHLTANCGVEGEPIQEVDAKGGLTSDIGFVVTCAAADPAGPGREIAFVTEREPFDGNALSRIYIMNDDGTGLRPKPGQQDGFIFALSWLPDGLTLSFLSQPDEVDIGSEILTLDPATEVVQTIIFTRGSDRPTWSPDGLMMAFVDNLAFDDGGSDQVFVADLNGENQHQLSSDAVNHTSPAWSPEGTRLAYVADESGEEFTKGIVVLDIVGTAEVPLVTGIQGSLDDLTWSPDGSKLAFSADNEFSPPAHIYTVDVQGGVPVQITHGRYSNEMPTWSPDGRRIAFASTRDGNWEIYVMNADGSEQTRLTNNPAADYGPAWRP
jgi:WD40 repeat protein